ncbi:Uncharacterised protein [Mycobacteroides abscessus subsp. massiliense]|nr:Uncharacterised protein [Mycobacteroides abscessus subsp. massiliense]
MTAIDTEDLVEDVVGDDKARQPTWFTGPSYQRMLHWGSKIHRSHVCG